MLLCGRLTLMRLVVNEVESKSKSVNGGLETAKRPAEEPPTPSFPVNIEAEWRKRELDVGLVIELCRREPKSVMSSSKSVN